MKAARRGADCSRFGFMRSPWQTAAYQEHQAIGRFEGHAFDPLDLEAARADGGVRQHARRRLGSGRPAGSWRSTDDMIRAVVKSGRSTSDPQAEALLANVLIQRRDKIGRAYLTRDQSHRGSGARRRQRADVWQRGRAVRLRGSPMSYRAVWYAFDNATGASTRIAETEAATARLSAPAGLPGRKGDWVRVELSATSAAYPSWAQPIQVYFTRLDTGWKLVGLERQPDGPVAPLVSQGNVTLQ